ncbi:MAG: type III-A CRISPR-associated RAMP protein Csm4 [Bacteroidia bacterium]|nr:type III-A CRISPR-associated RAMP protein Csm4 [Bacteroidia bacterium]
MPDNQLHAVLLYPLSGFKPELRSDTLWGTLCWAIRSVYGNQRLEDWLTRYLEGQPPMLISSTFPFEEEPDGTIAYFLPRPLLPPIKEGPLDFEAMRLFKKDKRVRYLPLPTLQRMALGKLSDKRLAIELRKELSQKNKLAQPKVQSESFTHNTIDRLRGGTLQVEGKAGQLFHDEERFVHGSKIPDTNEQHKKAGLFFLVQTDDIAMLDACFRWLRHSGIGGDRSVGKGVFVHKIVPFSWQTPASPNACLNLSLFQPTRDQLTNFKGQEPLFYQLEERQGDVSFGGYGRARKDPHYFFTEGSVFPNSAPNPWGSLVEVGTSGKNPVPHKVYQYAYALTLPFQLVRES